MSVTTPLAAQIEALCKRVFLAAHSDGWRGNQLRRDTANVDADKSWDAYVGNGALAKSIAVQPAIVTALRQAEAAPGVVEADIEAAARAMCDRVNGTGDYDENIEQRRSGWMAQAKAGIEAARARQHGAREGKIGMEYDPYEEAEREEKKRIAADVRRRFPAAPATDVGERNNA